MAAKNATGVSMAIDGRSRFKVKDLLF